MVDLGFGLEHKISTHLNKLLTHRWAILVRQMWAV